jgi:hypothetical protein
LKSHRALFTVRFLFNFNDTKNAISVRMKIVIRPLVLHEQHDENANRNADRQSGNIDDGVYNLFRAKLRSATLR